MVAGRSVLNMRLPINLPLQTFDLALPACAAPIEQLRPRMEEIKANFGREIEDWREQYYWSARYYALEGLLSMMLAGTYDVMEANQRYSIEALELKRQVLLTIAIGASLLSLFCLLVYVRSVLEAFSVATNPKKNPTSGLYLKHTYFGKAKRKRR